MHSKSFYLSSVVNIYNVSFLFWSFLLLKFGLFRHYYFHSSLSQFNSFSVRHFWQFVWHYVHSTFCHSTLYPSTHRTITVMVLLYVTECEIVSSQMEKGYWRQWLYRRMLGMSLRKNSNKIPVYLLLLMVIDRRFSTQLLTFLNKDPHSNYSKVLLFYL